MGGGQTILTNIATLLVDVLELAQGFNDIDALPSPRNDQFGTLMKTVVKHLQSLEYVSPILTLVVQSLV